MPKTLQNPEQELRFTRSRQATPFWLAAAVLLASALILVVTARYRDENPALPHPLWGLLPAALAGGAGRLAYRMTRHAYLILTPMGVEVFPLFRPEHNMQVIFWQQIAEFDSDESGSRLSLHFNPEHSSGVHLSLRPIATERRQLLLHAMRMRMSKNPTQPATGRDPTQPAKGMDGR